MSAERYAFDTNILFYALDPDGAGKHRIAERLISSADPARAVMSLQTLGELCHVIRRKRPGLAAEAERFVLGALAFFEVHSANGTDLADALRTQRLHKLSFWDAMLLATVRRAGCTLLLSEDFQDGRTLSGITVRNPFSLSAADLAQVIG